jgi:uncharacterized protein (DUF433 family)
MRFVRNSIWRIFLRISRGIMEWRMTNEQRIIRCVTQPKTLAVEVGRCNLLVMSSEQLLSRITLDPNVCHGKPCIRGLRYPVDFLLDLLSGDMTPEQILADYPDLEAADLRAAIAYAARLSRIKSIEPLAA